MKQSTLSYLANFLQGRARHPTRNDKTPASVLGNSRTHLQACVEDLQKVVRFLWNKGGKLMRRLWTVSSTYRWLLFFLFYCFPTLSTVLPRFHSPCFVFIQQARSQHVQYLAHRLWMSVGVYIPVLDLVIPFASSAKRPVGVFARTLFYNVCQGALRSSRRIPGPHVTAQLRSLLGEEERPAATTTGNASAHKPGDRHQ